MKSNLILCTIMLFLVIGCKKKSTQQADLPTGMSATIGEYTWNAKYDTVYFEPIPKNTLNIVVGGTDEESFNGSGNLVYITMTNFQRKPGIYHTDSITNVSFSYMSSGIFFLDGTVTFSKVSATNIQGTFTGTFKNIPPYFSGASSGSFNVPIK